MQCPAGKSWEIIGLKAIFSWVKVQHLTYAIAPSSSGLCFLSQFTNLKPDTSMCRFMSNQHTWSSLALILQAFELCYSNEHHFSKWYFLIWCFVDDGKHISLSSLSLQCNSSFSNLSNMWPSYPIDMVTVILEDTRRNVSSYDERDHSEHLCIDLCWPFPLRRPKPYRPTINYLYI